MANDSRIAFFIELLKSNKTPASMTLRAEPTAIRAFFKEIGASNNRSLKSLDLCGCKLGDDVGIEVGRHMLLSFWREHCARDKAAGRQCPPLGHHHRHRHQDHVVALQVGTCLKTNKGLQRLDLDHNQIGPKALAAIAVGLQSNDTLVSLSLEHNPLTGELPAGGSGTDDSSLVDLSGVAALSEALKTNTSVKSLNLFQVGLTQNGGTLVMQAVEGNAHLESVQLSGNDGCDVFDLRRITDKLRANVAAHAAARAAGKQDRAVARKAEAEAEDEAEAKASADAEVAWVERERKEREDRRAALAFEEFRKDRLAQLQRETDEKARQARLKAEAEEKAKKAKKK